MNEPDRPEVNRIGSSNSGLTLTRANNAPLNPLPHETAESTAEAWTKYTDSAYAHFAEMKALLDEKDPSYAD